MLINHNRLFYSGTAKKPFRFWIFFYKAVDEWLWYARARIFKPAYFFHELKILKVKNYMCQFLIVSKINQGRCLGCLGGRDAPGLDQIGSDWIKLDQIGSIWFNLAQTWSNWIKLDQLGSTWLKLDQIGSNWIKLDQTWSNWIKLDQTWSNC